MPKSIMLKLGGSLIHQGCGEVLRRIGHIITQDSAEHPLLIVPGGGPFADLVRQYGKQLELREETCHFMALAAMDQYAFILQELIAGSMLTALSPRASTAPVPLIHPGEPQILLCSRFLNNIPAGDLPRSWEVTSDSIAAYLAQRMNSSMLVIVKSKDIDPALPEPDIDPFFRQLLPLRIPIWFINGLYPERFTRLLQTGSTQGVYLPPNRLCGQFVP